MGFLKKLATKIGGESLTKAAPFLAIGSPVAGALALGLGSILKEKDAKNPDLFGGSFGGRGTPDNPLVPGDTPAPPAATPVPFFPYAGGSSGLSGGGIPVALLTQLGGALRQQTPAVRLMAAKAAGARGGTRSARKRKKAARAAAPRRRAKRNGKKKYNTAAWMKKIRGMRKKK